MATSKDKKTPWLNGTLRGNVYYELNDTRVVRGIGKSNKLPTVPQKTAWQATKVTSALLGDLMPYINIGFEAVAKIRKSSQQNQAFSYNRKQAIIGTYPNVKVDYAKVLLSMGPKPLPQEVVMVLVEDGLSINWNTDLNVPDSFWDDQVLIIAYFPTLPNAVFSSGGSKRYQGTEHLPLIGIKRGNVMHVYFSIISNTRTSISNSIYLGEMIW